MKKMLKRLGVVIPSTILTLLMAVGFSTPAFAFVDTTEVMEEPTQVIEEADPTEEETPAVVLPETKPEPAPDVEIEEPKEESSGGMNKILLLVFVAALGGAGAFFYFYIYKPKPKEETPQSENLETDQSLATVNEDNQPDNENGT